MHYKLVRFKKENGYYDEDAIAQEFDGVDEKTARFATFGALFGDEDEMVADNADEQVSEKLAWAREQNRKLDAKREAKAEGEEQEKLEAAQTGDKQALQWLANNAPKYVETIYDDDSDEQYPAGAIYRLREQFGIRDMIPNAYDADEAVDQYDEATDVSLTTVNAADGHRRYDVADFLFDNGLITLSQFEDNDLPPVNVYVVEDPQIIEMFLGAEEALEMYNAQVEAYAETL